MSILLDLSVPLLGLRILEILHWAIKPFNTQIVWEEDRSSLDESGFRLLNKSVYEQFSSSIRRVCRHLQTIYWELDDDHLGNWIARGISGQLDNGGASMVMDDDFYDSLPSQFWPACPNPSNTSGWV